MAKAKKPTVKTVYNTYKKNNKYDDQHARKHPIEKVDDANGNDDAVFTGSNVKAYDRRLEHGYNPGEDEKYYEEVQPLDELSRKTLASYAYKSAMDLADKEGNRRMHIMGHDGEQRTQKSFQRKLKDSIKRQVGIGMATRKLAKEEVELDELHRDTLASYQRKAALDLSDTARHGGTRPGTRESGKVMKRANGIAIAGQKLAKNLHRVHAQEETELQELSYDTEDSYMRKANRGPNSWSAYGLRARMAKFKAHDAADAGDAAGEAAAMKKMRDAHRKMVNRGKGIDKIMNKRYSYGEETELQELSRDTLVKYAHHASGDVYAAGRQGDNHRAKNRVKGITRAAGRLAYNAGRPLSKLNKIVTNVGEETELQELSKKTLGKYVSRAAPNMLAHAERSTAHSLKRDIDNPALDKPHYISYHNYEADKHARKALNREKGIKTAAKRLVGEETELQELSKKTLGRYIKSASIAKSGEAEQIGFVNGLRASDTSTRTDRDEQGKANKRHARRSLGIQRAASKLSGDDY